MLSTGAHNPRVAKLLKDPNEKLPNSKDPENEPEKELGEDSQEEKEKENSGYTLAQEDVEKDSEGKDASVLPQEVSAAPQEISAVPQEVSAAPQEEKDNCRLNFSSNKPNSFSDKDSPEKDTLKSIEAEVAEGLVLPLLGNTMPFNGNVILRNSYISACTTTSDSNTIPKAYCSVQKAEPGKDGTGLG